MHNIDEKTVAGFGAEWQRFSQETVDEQELYDIFCSYFALFSWESLPAESEGFDLGCGSGRWAKFVAPKVGRLHCIDPSDAIDVASRHLSSHSNIEFHRAGVSNMPLKDSSMDFGYSLGVLHHVPETEAGIRSCVVKLKPNAPFLIYLYYALDGRPAWFRNVWKLSNIARSVIAELPPRLKMRVADAIAGLIYWPLAKSSQFLANANVDTSNIPLSAYKDRSFYTMRTDALDRFGTRLEKRFTRSEVASMMAHAGLHNIQVSDKPPYWCAIGYRSR